MNTTTEIKIKSKQENTLMRKKSGVDMSNKIARAKEKSTKRT